MKTSYKKQIAAPLKSVIKRPNFLKWIRIQEMKFF